MALTLWGCGELFLPTVKDLQEANASIISSSYQLKPVLSFISDRVILSYNSEIQFCGKTSCWDGRARVLYKKTVFQQECKSYTADAGSWKSWRSTFSESDTVSPADQIAQWLAMAGKGKLIPQTVAASSISDSFPQEVGLVYLLVLDQCPVDWNALCDAHIDILFGGEDLLDTAGACKVTLMFQESTLQLVGIFISAQSGETALESAIRIEPSVSAPVVDESAFANCQESAPLAEEWEMMNR